MVSTHTRNVTGMHRARRCEAITLAGERCCAPAVTGKKRCHKHGGKGSKGKTHADKLGDYSKATMQRDKLVRKQVKKFDRLIRQFERDESLQGLVPETREIRQELLRTTQQRQAELTAAYIADPVEREPARYVPPAGTPAPARGQSEWLFGDRARGAMIGLALGEAIGLTLEGQPRDSYREVTSICGGGILDLKPGQWAADTAMALSLMDSLIWRGRLDQVDLMDRFAEWHEDGVNSCTGVCTGIDAITREALAAYKLREEPVASFAHAGAFGNGSLARLAPVAIRYWNERGKLRKAAERQSETTHSSPYAIDACIAFAEVLADAIDGSSRTFVFGPRDTTHVPSVETIMWGSWKGKPRRDICSDNNVLNSLEAAMWCVERTGTFEEAVLRAANLGEDAGSLAAITGQLAGAYYGVSAIPDHWLKQLAWRDRIEEQADRLFKRSLGSDRVHR